MMARLLRNDGIEVRKDNWSFVKVGNYYT
jgi:hypothetical protein